MAKKDNTFLLISLEGDKAKKLANVIGSEACRKLLDYLANKSATETELSKKLEMPISTVHYNMQQLVKAGLIKAEEFHYSEKGREVNHYSIANKYIIIAPKTTESLANKLKRILPVFAIVAATGIAVQFFAGLKQTAFGTTAQQASREMTGEVAQKVSEASVESAPFAATQVVQPSIALWFVIGALFALIVYLIYDVVKERLNS